MNDIVSGALLFTNERSAMGYRINKLAMALTHPAALHALSAAIYPSLPIPAAAPAGPVQPGSWDQALALAIEQSEPQFGFQRLDLMADRRRRYIQFMRGALQAEVPRRRFEHLERIQRR